MIASILQKYDQGTKASRAWTYTLWYYFV